MTDRVFVDTNVWIYARDRNEPTKRELAKAWLLTLTELQLAYVNLQVLNDYTRLLLRRDPSADLDEVREEVEDLRVWGDRPFDADDVELAWTVRHDFKFQWFDCLLLAAADRAGCRYFLTEDMIDRATFKGVTLVNPFRHRPADLFSQH